AVVFAVIARAAPERSLRGIDQDRVDRTGGPFPDLYAIAHRRELRAHPSGRVGADDQTARLRRLRAEGAVHLIAVDVGRFRRLLRVHPELDDVQEELEEVLLLAVAALDGERQERLALEHRETRRQRRSR